MAKTKPKVNGTRTYVLDLADGGQRQVTVPSTWKMTFGSLVPYEARSMSKRPVGPAALRFYEGNKENLRAVMIDVVAFREASMIVSEIDKASVESRKKLVNDKTAVAEYQRLSGEITPVDVEF